MYGKTCAHMAGGVPGAFNVTCVLSETGTYCLRGHLRVQPDDGLTFNYWTNQEFIIVAA